MMPPTLSPALHAPQVEVLPNGLTIIAEQLPVEAVSFHLWLGVGSRWEGDEINGMAHFLEHMVFKGTPRLAMGEFERLVEGRGALTNAATSQDYTHFYTTCAPQDFADLAPLQLEVVLNPALAADPFERERGVVLEEIRRSLDDPQRRLFQRLFQLAFPNSPYGRPVLGEAAIIEGLRVEQMRDFHAHWYQPSEMTATVVGNQPIAVLVDTIAKAFGERYGIRSPAQPLEPPLLPDYEPFKTVEQDVVIDPQLHQARLMVLWRIPGLDQFDELLALSVLAVILGRGRVSRLFRELREEKGLVQGIGASNALQARQGVFYIGAQLPAANLVTVEARILDHIARCLAEPLSPQELQRIGTQVANRFIFSHERPGDRAHSYGYYYSQMGELAPALTYPERIQALTPETVQRTAQRYLAPTAYGRLVAVARAEDLAGTGWY